MAAVINAILDGRTQNDVDRITLPLVGIPLVRITLHD